MVSNKLPFAYVELHVNNLYNKEFDENDTVGIDQHIDFIKSFINASGWDEEEYSRVLMGLGPSDQLDKQLN